MIYTSQTYKQDQQYSAVKTNVKLRLKDKSFVSPTKNNCSTQASEGEQSSTKATDAASVTSGSTSQANGGNLFKSNRKSKKGTDSSKKPVVEEKYKTELCKSFQTSGKCKYGPKCKFAHGKNELSIKKVENKPYKVLDCENFHKQGICKYGNRCHYIHDTTDAVERSCRNYYQQKMENFEIFEILEKVPQPSRLAVLRSLTKESGSKKRLNLNVPHFAVSDQSDSADEAESSNQPSLSTNDDAEEPPIFKEFNAELFVKSHIDDLDISSQIECAAQC